MTLRAIMHFELFFGFKKGKWYDNSVLEMIGLAVMAVAVMIMNLDGQRLPMR